MSDNWISVEERLPEAFVTVIVCDAAPHTIVEVGAGYMREPGKWSAYPLCHKIVVTHWQPLPAPPKREGEK